MTFVSYIIWPDVTFDVRNAAMLKNNTKFDGS